MDLLQILQCFIFSIFEKISLSLKGKKCSQNTHLITAFSSLLSFCLFQIKSIAILLKKNPSKKQKKDKSQNQTNQSKKQTQPPQNQNKTQIWIFLLLERIKLFAFSEANQRHQQWGMGNFCLTVFKKVICAVFLIHGDYKCFCIKKIAMIDFKTSGSHLKLFWFFCSYGYFFLSNVIHSVGW